MKPFLKTCRLLTIFSVVGLNALAQDSTLLKAAENSFAQGLEFYNKKDYRKSINHLLHSSRILPRAVTYYLLANAYCQSLDFPKTKAYAQAALDFKNPSLATKFVPDAQKIRDFAIYRLKPEEPEQSSQAVTGQAITHLPQGITPTADENPYVNPNRKMTIAPGLLVHRQHSNGQITIRQTFTCDLDNGSEGSSAVADFWWEYQTQTIRYLTPRNGARFYILRTTDFDAVDYTYLKSISTDQYSHEKMPGFKSSVYSPFELSPGIVVAYITNEGRLGKLKILNLDSKTLPIQWVTYEN